MNIFWSVVALVVLHEDDCEEKIEELELKRRYKLRGEIGGDDSDEVPCPLLGEKSG